MKKLVVLWVMVMGVILLASAGCGVDTYTETEATISTSVNQEFIIALQHPSPRVGNHWEESHNDKMLSLIEITYTPDDKSHPDFGGTQNFRFKAMEAGRTEAAFTYKTVTDRIIEQKEFNIDIK